MTPQAFITKWKAATLRSAGFPGENTKFLQWSSLRSMHEIGTLINLCL